MAWIASSVEVCAVIMMTGVGSFSSRTRLRRSRPLPPGRLDVAEDHVGVRADRGGRAFGVVRGRQDLEALLVEQQPEHVPQRLLVVDDQDPRAAHWTASVGIR
jgi:hypothetical protein